MLVNRIVPRAVVLYAVIVRNMRPHRVVPRAVVLGAVIVRNMLPHRVVPRAVVLDAVIVRNMLPILSTIPHLIHNGDFVHQDDEPGDAAEEEDEDDDKENYGEIVSTLTSCAGLTLSFVMVT